MQLRDLSDDGAHSTHGLLLLLDGVDRAGTGGLLCGAVAEEFRQFLGGIFSNTQGVRVLVTSVASIGKVCNKYDKTCSSVLFCSRPFLPCDFRY